MVILFLLPTSFTDIWYQAAFWMKILWQPNEDPVSRDMATQHGQFTNYFECVQTLNPWTSKFLDFLAFIWQSRPFQLFSNSSSLILKDPHLLLRPSVLAKSGQSKTLSQEFGYRWYFREGDLCIQTELSRRRPQIFVNFDILSRYLFQTWCIQLFFCFKLLTDTPTAFTETKYKTRHGI